MAKDRRNFTGAEELAILREHLIEKVPISQMCDRHGLLPTAAHGHWHVDISYLNIAGTFYCLWQ